MSSSTWVKPGRVALGRDVTSAVRRGRRHEAERRGSEPFAVPLVQCWDGPSSPGAGTGVPSSCMQFRLGASARSCQRYKPHGACSSGLVRQRQIQRNRGGARRRSGPAVRSRSGRDDRRAGSGVRVRLVFGGRGGAPQPVEVRRRGRHRRRHGLMRHVDGSPGGLGARLVGVETRPGRPVISRLGLSAAGLREPRPRELARCLPGLGRLGAGGLGLGSLGFGSLGLGSAGSRQAGSREARRREPGRQQAGLCGSARRSAGSGSRGAWVSGAWVSGAWASGASGLRELGSRELGVSAG